MVTVAPGTAAPDESDDRAEDCAAEGLREGSASREKGERKDCERKQRKLRKKLFISSPSTIQ